MVKLTNLLPSLIICLLFSGIVIAHCTNQLILEFLYWNPKDDPHYCEECPDWFYLYQDFLRKNETIERIQNEYANKTLVRWIEFESSEGQTERQLYHIFQPNSIVIKSVNSNVTVIEGEFNETSIKEIIDAYLQEILPQFPSSPPFVAIFALAFYFGFQETFSPCLLVLLSFLLSYSFGQALYFREGFLRVIMFGFGFLASALLFGVTVGLLFLSLSSLLPILTLIICILAIIFGFCQLFLQDVFQTKPIIKKLSEKYAFSYLGLFALGLLFYFLDPCIAPVFFVLLPLLKFEYFPLVLLAFSSGVIIPFALVGFFSGSCLSSQEARINIRQKSRP